MATDDEREPSASDDSLADRDEAPARSKPARSTAKATKKAARPAPARSDDEDEDEDLDDEDEDLDDEDGDDEGDDEPPPPRKVSRAAPASKKAPASSKKAPVKKKKTVTVKRVPAKPASHFIPFSILGMLMIGGHVFWDVAFAPLAVLGISVVIWSYMGIGSANEPV